MTVKIKRRRIPVGLAQPPNSPKTWGFEVNIHSQYEYLVFCPLVRPQISPVPSLFIEHPSGGWYSVPLKKSLFSDMNFTGSSTTLRAEK